MQAKTFSDVIIKPKYSTITSRELVDVSTNLNKVQLTFPIVTSNMRTITGSTMANKISKFGGLGILHRFYPNIEENIKEFLAAINPNKESNIGVSIGVKDIEKRRFEDLYKAGARIFCIDVAHGHHLNVKNMLKWVNNEIFLWDRSARNKITLIAGNIATSEGAQDLMNWGADVLKVGLGPGRVCTTRKNTGVGVPQLYALEEIFNNFITYQNTPISIIADGGCVNVGDIAKALKYANAVMIGSMIAGTDETPGDVFKDDKGLRYKIYGGSASRETKGHNFFVEGVTIKVSPNGPVKTIFYEIKDGLRSAFSYVGAANLKEFQQNCEFIEITNSARLESKYD